MKLLVLLAVVALALASGPQVDQNLDLWPQNGGTFVVTGYGFVQDAPETYDWILSDGTTTLHSSTYVDGLRGGSAPVGWEGCRSRTMKISPSGFRLSCVMQYIPDSLINNGAVWTIALDIVNENGQLQPNPVTVAIVENVDEIIFSDLDAVIPNTLYGISLTGAGFPAFDSISYVNPANGAGNGADTWEISLSDGTTTRTIDIIGGVLQTTYSVPSVSGVLTSGFINPSLQGTLSGAMPSSSCECRHTRTTVDCHFCPEMIFTVGTTPNRVMTASMTYESSDLGFSTVEFLGLANIATVNDDWLEPVVYENLDILRYNQEEIVIRGNNFALYPAHASNLVTFYDPNELNSNPATTTINGEPFRCQVTGVRHYTEGDELTCRPNAQIPPASPPGTQVPLRIHMVVGNQFSYNASMSVAGFIPATVGIYDFTSPIFEVKPTATVIQQDARFLSIMSFNNGWPVDLILNYDDSVADVNLSDPPSEIVTTVTLTGIQSGPVTCQWVLPYNDIPRDSAGNQECAVVSMDSREIIVRLPDITEPVRNPIEAEVSTRWDTAGVTRTTSTQLVGVIGLAAGVGGDPHFFGFQGEKYEFAGKAGEVYNILTDTDVQLNAEIGYWHFNKGSETIVRKLALRTDNHELIIDAGGNFLGSEAFSITMDSELLEGGRHVKNSLGDGQFVRWFYTEDEKVVLPLWERHEGVAVVEIKLESYHFTVIAVEEGRDRAGVQRRHPSRFLDFQCQMLDAFREPHGLFGQSAHIQNGQRAVDWHIEGSDDDYRVTSLFGSDFKFNKFAQ